MTWVRDGRRAKNTIKSLSVMYSKERKKNMRKEERVLRKKLEMELSRADDEEGYSMEKYIEVKMELERYEREKCRGAILRSKAKYALKERSVHHISWG